MTSKGSAQNRLEKLRQQLKVARSATQPVRPAKPPKLSHKNDSSDSVSPSKGIYSSSKLATRLLQHKKLTPPKRAILKPKKVGDSPSGSGTFSPGRAGSSPDSAERLQSVNPPQKGHPENVRVNSQPFPTYNRVILKAKKNEDVPIESASCRRNASSCGNSVISLSGSCTSRESNKCTENVTGFMLAQTHNPEKSRPKDKDRISEMSLKLMNSRKAIGPSSLDLEISAPKIILKEEACCDQSLSYKNEKRKSVSDRLLRIKKNNTINKNIDSKQTVRKCHSPLKKVNSSCVPQSECTTLDKMNRLPPLRGSECYPKRLKAEPDKTPLIKSPEKRKNGDTKQKNKEIPFAVKKNLYKRKKIDENSMGNILGKSVNKEQDLIGNITSNKAKHVKMKTFFDKKTPCEVQNSSERVILEEIEARGKESSSSLDRGSNVEPCCQNRRNAGSPIIISDGSRDETPTFANTTERLFSPFQTNPTFNSTNSNVPQIASLTHVNKPAEHLEYMEWEEIPQHEILRTVRNEVDPREELMDWQEIPQMEVTHPAEKSFYFVVDTNVLISSLNLIQAADSVASVEGVGPIEV